MAVIEETAAIHDDLNLEAIILAGGLGTRLRGIIKDVPKPMAPINGRPFLEYLIIYLRNQGVKRLILAVGFLAQKVIDYFGDGEKHGVEIEYSVEDKPLGTGGAIKRACQKLSTTSFLCLNGDSFCQLDLKQFYTFHKQKFSLGSLNLVKTNNGERYGNVSIDLLGRVISFKEKSTNGTVLINSGVYIFEKRIFESIPNKIFSLEQDLIPKLVGSSLYGTMSNGYFIDIGIPEDYITLANDPIRFLQLINYKGEEK